MLCARSRIAAQQSLLHFSSLHTAIIVFIVVEGILIEGKRLRTSDVLNRQSESSRPPDLGIYKTQFDLTSFLAAGGQADVWLGMEIKTARQVVLRFPQSLCEKGTGNCLVKEIDSQTDAEWRKGCEMARAAKDRQDAHFGPGAQSFFSECIRALSVDKNDPAFEVWSYDGDMTLAEGFFTNTSRVVSIEQKRDIIRQLKDAIAVLSASHSDSSDCCCPHQAAQLDSTPCSASGRLGVCPEGFSRTSLSHCGPVVHHDVKFDNIVMSFTDDSITAKLIDFGASVRCFEGHSPGFSRDWAPYWLDDGHSFARAECWAYDTYSLGFLWLIVELLAELPKNQLACDVAIEKGIAEVLDGDTCLQMVSPLDSEVSQAALLPVNVLAHDLRRHFINNPFGSSYEEFVEGLEKFVDTPQNRSKETRRLKLVLPPVSELWRIFPMLLECPLFPGESWHEDMTGQQAACNFFHALEQLSVDIANHDSKRLLRSLDRLRSACALFELCSHGSCLGDVDDRFSGWSIEEFRRSCQMHMDPALITMINDDDVDGLLAFLSETSEDAVLTNGDNLTPKQSQIDESIEVIRETPLVETVLANGESLLATASRAGSIEVVRTLLRQRARVVTHARVIDSNTSSGGNFVGDFVPLSPLLAAATRSGNAEVLRLLVDAAKSEVQDLPETLATLCAFKTFDGISLGASLLSTLAQTGDLEMMSMILEVIETEPQYLKLAMQGTGKDNVPLIRAARGGFAKVCRRLLLAGADSADIDSQDRTALANAVLSGDVQTVKILGESSGAVLSMLQGGSTPLHLAVTISMEVVSVLISLGADQGAVDARGDTGLHRAVQHSSDVQVVRKLAASTVAQQRFNKEYLTPLAIAAGECRSVALLRAVMEFSPGAVLQMQDRQCYTPIMRAAAAGKVECLRVLAARSSIDFRCSNGLNAWAVATIHYQERAARVLVDEFGAKRIFIPRSERKFIKVLRRSSFRA